MWRRRIAASGLTGVLRIGYLLVFVIPSGALQLRVTVSDRRMILGFLLVFAVVFTPISRVHGRRVFRPVEEWLDSGRPPTEQEQAQLLAQPRQQALGTAGYWIIGGILAASCYTLLYGNIWHAALILLGVTLLGFHAAAFVFALVEHALRPTTALALTGSQPEQLSILSVRNRFLLAWGFGSGVSMLGIAIFLSLRTGASEGDLGRAIWPIVVLAFVEGFILISLAARSVTEPMNEVRVAMKRVLEGDLEAEVPVDAGSEVALLQVGFNRMVAGLRERHRLSELLNQHVGTDVARQALERGADFQGVEVEATILIVDLIGSTPFAETRPTAEVLSTLNCLFEAVVRTTGAAGGWVNKFAGDAAVCVFGAPVELPDHAARALRTACELHDELVQLHLDHPWLDAGIGVSSGSVIAANVGSSSRYEFTIVGDAANEASRLTDWAKRRPGRILVSGRSIALAGVEEGTWAPAGSLELRGKANPTAVFEPVASVVADAEHELAAGAPSRFSAYETGSGAD